MRHVITVMLLVAVLPAFAVDRADLESTQITGSRELPKVVYIVPWKQPLPGELVGPPPGSLLAEVLAPVDREVFRREVRYHSLMHGGASPTAGAVPAAAR